MARKQQTSKAPADGGGMATVLVGDTAAIGQDTLTEVNAISRVIDTGHKIKAKGVVIATAAAEPAEGGTAFADAFTDVTVEGADKVIIRTKTISGVNDDGSSYEISITKFKAVDWVNKDGDTKLIVHERHIVNDHIDVELDGNVATVKFDAAALGGDSLVNADVYALTVEDDLSISTLLLTSAVG